MQSFFASLAELAGFSAARYFVIAGIAFIIFYILLHKKLTRSKIQKRLAGKTDFLREILYSVQTTAVLAIIAAVILETPLVRYTRVYAHLSDYPVWYLPLSLLLCLIIHDTYFYWMHRLLHHKKIFNLTHLVHHRSVNPSPWTSYSFHFLEAWTEGGVLVAIVMVLPVHPLTILLFTVTSFIINVYGHLGFEIVPRGFRHSFLFEILNTSVHHNLHHSRFKGNYGLYFRVWDRVMGTEHPEYVKEFDKLQERRFGPAAVDHPASI